MKEALAVLRECDALLRFRSPYAAAAGRVPVIRCLVFVAGGGFAYGAVMGASDLRPLQALYSGVKVPLLLSVSALICVPNFYVVNSLLGLRKDFSAACRGVLSAQATLAVALAGLSPLTAFFYLSSGSYSQATAFNAMQFALATAAGQAALNRHYRPLIAANPRHGIARKLWLLLYIFVAIQMAWVLRPFIGAPDLPTSFFRAEAWSNAYVQVMSVGWKALRG